MIRSAIFHKEVSGAVLVPTFNFREIPRLEYHLVFLKVENCQRVEIGHIFTHQITPVFGQKEQASEKIVRDPILADQQQTPIVVAFLNSHKVVRRRLLLRQEQAKATTHWFEVAVVKPLQELVAFSNV